VVCVPRPKLGPDCGQGAQQGRYLAQAVDVFHGGPDVTLQSNLPGLTLDILLLLALSSKRSRDYALSPSKEPKRDSNRPGGRALF